MQLYTWYCKIRGFWCFPKVAWKRMVEASPFLHTLLGNLTPICQELCWELCQIHPDAETQTETSRNTLMCKKNKSETGDIQNDPTLSQHEPLTISPLFLGPHTCHSRHAGPRENELWLWNYEFELGKWVIFDLWTSIDSMILLIPLGVSASHSPHFASKLTPRR